MRDRIASAARVLLNVSAIFGWVLLGMILVYSAGGAFTKVDIAILFALSAAVHLAMIKASHADHYTITLHEGDPGFDELLRKITEDDDEA
jgi:hypothetical protein